MEPTEPVVVVDSYKAGRAEFFQVNLVIGYQKFRVGPEFKQAPGGPPGDAKTSADWRADRLRMALRGLVGDMVYRSLLEAAKASDNPDWLARAWQLAVGEIGKVLPASGLENQFPISEIRNGNVVSETETEKATEEGGPNE